MAPQLQVTFDAAEPHELARWWAELLGYEVEDHHDRIEQMLAGGIVDESIVTRVDGRLHFADLVGASDPDGARPRLLFQRVPEPKTAKNRMHLDVQLAGDDLDAAVSRVVATGATFVEDHEHPGQRWAILRDPEGNEFCIT